MSSLDGAFALVTGGGTGIGRGIAAALLREGATVTLMGRRESVLEAAAEELRSTVAGAAVRVFAGDVTVPEQVEQAVDAAAGPHGRLDVAVANAGTGLPGPFLLLDDAAWRFCCELNIVGTASTFRAAAKRMQDGGGALIAISTAAAAAPETSMSAYSATKAAVDTMVKAAAWELGTFGIRVNSIQPGYIPTDSTESAFTPALSADLVQRSALRRTGSTADIAAMVVHLAGPAGAFITGQVIAVDGGMTVQPMADLTDLSRRLYGDEAVRAALGTKETS